MTDAVTQAFNYELTREVSVLTKLLAEKDVEIANLHHILNEQNVLIVQLNTKASHLQEIIDNHCQG